jgi:gluconate 2-dehydrogenase gamma chain
VRLRRRKFLKIGVSAAVAGSAVSCTRIKSPWRFFTPEEARTVEAISEQIIPADQDPGAARAGVVNYIDRQLVGHYAEYQKTYRQGIASVEKASLTTFTARFVDLPFEQQTKVLHAIEKKEREFFSLIVPHTMQGFYGDPRHGGNRDRMSWKMLGVPYPPVRGRRKV